MEACERIAGALARGLVRGKSEMMSKTRGQPVRASGYVKVGFVGVLRH